MKKTVKMILSCVLISFAAGSQGQTWNSAIEEGLPAPGIDYCRPLDATTSGISFIGGRFTGTVYFGAASTITLTSTGTGTDAFLTRLISSAGSASWAVKIGGSGNDAITKVELAGSSVLIYGTTTASSVTLNGTSGSPVTLTGLSGAFLARYTSSGVLTWAVPYTGNVSDMAFVPSSNILYTIGADAVSSNKTRIRSVNATTGAVLYDVLSTNTGLSTANKGIAGDASSNVYILVDGMTNFKVPSSPTVALSTAASDLVLMKLDATLSYQAHATIGSSLTLTNEIAKDLDCSLSTGDIYITGTYASGSCTIGSTTLTNTGAADLFVAKYTNSLIPVWATKIGGTGNDLPLAMSLDPNSWLPFLLVQNQPTNSVTVDPCSAITYTSSSSGFDNKWYMVKYTSTGTIDWSASPLSIDATALPVAVQGQNTSANIFGYNIQQTDFGSTTLVGAGSIYVARASKLTGCKPAGTTGIEEEGAGNELTVYPNPTNGSVSIPLDTDDKNVQVILTDNLGKQVMKINNLESNHGVLNMETLPAGIYFYTVLKNNTSYKGKIVKQ